MRRPLCLLCAGVLGVELVCAFLPQAWLLPLLAAFFVACLLWALLRRSPVRGYGLCLLLGGVLGLALAWNTQARLGRLQSAWEGREALLTAEVESVSASYYPGAVNAVLHVRQLDGRDADLRVKCTALPRCTAGERVQGRFALERPEESQSRSLYADGIALNAELTGKLRHLGESRSFRARTARWQRRLSSALRSHMAPDPGGVLAAMVTGDRSHLSAPLRTAYRAAGLSHVLVVSGMHVSILCGGLFERWLPEKRRRERSYASRKLQALFRAGMALLLVGVTGLTPSVLRAAAAVWVSALGVWVYGPPDALTSLGLAGVWMTLGNSYAVCDIGFELSFAAVLGTLAGAELARRGREMLWASRKHCRPGRSRWKKPLAGVLESLLETLCVSACASAATFPVLVLRGLSASLYALVSSVAALWLVEPMLLLGLATALLGIWPPLAPLHRVCGLGAAFLAELLDRWALRVSGWPGAQLSFDTACAALVCLLLLFLGWLAVRWNIRLRVALPCLGLAAALAIGSGNALSRDIVRVELAGSRNAPAVVITQGECAVVLFRGGSATQEAVETVLTRRGIRKIALLADLRLAPQTPCTLEAEESISTDAMARYTTRRARSGPVELELLRVQSGCIVRVEVAGRQLVTLSGSVQLANSIQADWLLASPARPDAVQYAHCLTLSRQYRWMETLAVETASRLALRPGGGERLG